MAAQFTTSTRFATVKLWWSASQPPPYLETISFLTDEVSSQSFEIGINSYTGQGLYDQDNENLAVARQIWAADGMFRDADGDEVTVEVDEYTFPPTITDLASLEAEGWPNPFVAADVAAWRNRLGIFTDQGRNITRATDSTTGLVTHTSKLGLSVAGRTPDGSTMTYPLSDWDVHQWGTNNFSWTLDISEENITTATVSQVDDLVAAQAMRAFLVAAKTAGPDVMSGLVGNRIGGDDSGNLDPETPTNTRVYTLSVNGTNMLFKIGTVGVAVGTGDDLVQLFIPVTLEAGSSFDRDTLAAWTRSQTATLTTVANSEIPPLESAGVIEAGSFRLSNGEEITTRNGRVVIKTPDRDIPIDSQGSRHTGQLTAATTPSTTLICSGPEVPAIHLRNGVATTRVRLQDPQDVLTPGNIARQIIHNRNSGSNTGQLILERTAGTDLLRLQPGQNVELTYDHLADGSGEIVFRDVPQRRHTLNVGDAGDISGSRFFDYSTAWWGRVLPAPAPTAQDYNDADAITLGTGVGFGEGLARNSITETQWLNQHTFRVLYDGHLYIDQQMEFHIPDSAIGSVPAGHFTRVYVFRNGSLQVIGPWVHYPSFGGGGHSFDYGVTWQGRVRRNDIIIPMIVYQKTANLNLGGCRARNFTRTVEFDPDIEVNIAASM